MKHTSETVLITPELATEWLQHNNFPRQRKVSKNYVIFFKECLLAGTLDGGEALRFVQCRGVRILVNGQHRLHAIVASGVAISIVVITTEVDDISEGAEIYARIDRGRHRSVADVLGAFSDYEENGLTVGQAALASSGALIVESNFRASLRGGSTYELRSAERRHALAIQYSKEAGRFFSIIAGGDPVNIKLLQRRAVTAVALAIYASPSAGAKADEFWGGAARDDGLRRFDPRKQLLRFLTKYTSARAKEAAMVARGTAACWNAFFAGRDLQIVRTGDVSVPITILGTRFNPRTAPSTLSHENGISPAP